MATPAATFFTSLDGISFPASANSFTAPTLQNGWTWAGCHVGEPPHRLAHPAARAGQVRGGPADNSA